MNGSLGGGALEVGDRRLLEDGSKRRDAIGSDAVVLDTVRDGWGHSERAGPCQRALTLYRTVWGGGAPKGGDLRLLEDGSKRGGALRSNRVKAETANEGKSRNVQESKRVNGRLHNSEHTKGGGALEVRDLRLLKDGSECGGALVSDVVPPETSKHGRGRGTSERPGVSMGADTKANALGRQRTSVV